MFVCVCVIDIVLYIVDVYVCLFVCWYALSRSLSPPLSLPSSPISLCIMCVCYVCIYIYIARTHTHAVLLCRHQSAHAAAGISADPGAERELQAQSLKSVLCRFSKVLSGCLHTR